MTERLSAQEILEMVTEKFGFKPDDLTIGKNKDQYTIRVRNLALFLIMENTNLNVREIGEILGGTAQHSIHASSSVTATMNLNPMFRRKVMELKLEIKRRNGEEPPEPPPTPKKLAA